MHSKNFLACLHVETSSLRLLSEAMCGLHIIKNFSHRQRLHFFVMFEYAVDCFILRQVKGFPFPLLFLSNNLHFYSGVTESLFDLLGSRLTIAPQRCVKLLVAKSMKF